MCKPMPCLLKGILPALEILPVRQKPGERAASACRQFEASAVFRGTANKSSDSLVQCFEQYSSSSYEEVHEDGSPVFYSCLMYIFKLMVFPKLRLTLSSSACRSVPHWPMQSVHLAERFLLCKAFIEKVIGERKMHFYVY